MTESKCSNETVNIVSFGAGQNSTAMVIEMVMRHIPIDEIIFADTGSEMPQTYAFIEEFKKWCKKYNLKFTIIKSKYGDLRQYYMEHKCIPYRMFRHCTDKFKIMPMNAYIKANYSSKNVVMFMGIASDEKHRCRLTQYKNITYRYPLALEWEWDRDKCVKRIEMTSLPIPVKSGCYFCPFQSKDSWLRLLNQYPELFDKSIEFEKNSRSYPKNTLLGKVKLEDLKRGVVTQTSLNTILAKDMPCVYCHL